MIVRRQVIWIENDTIGDGDFKPLLAHALREYANLVERVGPDPEQPEVFESSNGTRFTCFFGTWLGDVIHHKQETP
jgi:hypothetical protein